MSSQQEFYELFTSPGIEVTNVVFPNKYVWFSWEYTEENPTTAKNVNVAVAAYVTTGAGLKLYSYLEELGESILQCGSNSVICIHEEGENHKVETGHCVGELTGELEEFGSGSFIEEHVSSGPNHYVYSILTSGTGKRLYKCKMQGITLIM